MPKKKVAKSKKSVKKVVKKILAKKVMKKEKKKVEKTENVKREPKGKCDDEKVKELLQQICVGIAGELGGAVVDLLYKKKNVDEFLISKKLNITINQVRNILYKLGDEGLVSFIRKKDLKRGGWYIYFWTLNVEKGLIRLRDKLEKDLGMFESNLESRKTKRFYYCENCDIEFNEESALLNDYACPECGELLGVKDNTGHVEHLGNSIVNIKVTLDCVKSELGFLMVKDDKARERRFKAEDKKKLMERRERAAVRAALKKKEAKKAERDAKKKGKKVKVKGKAKKKVVKKKAKKKVVKKKAKKKVVKKKAKKKVVKKKAKKKVSKNKKK